MHAPLHAVRCFAVGPTHPLPLHAVPAPHIAGKAGRFLYDPIIDRDLVVLAGDAASLPEPPPRSPKSEQERSDDLASMLRRSLRIDEATAKFYLKDAGGDLKQAIRRAAFASGPACTELPCQSLCFSVRSTLWCHAQGTCMSPYLLRAVALQAG